MRVLITICARGGSKGIPGKNIRPLNGKPLIAYSIDCAIKFKEKHPETEIVLSTDSEEILRVASECGLKSDYRRPDYLASDTAGKIDAIRDVVKYYEEKNDTKYDYVLDLDCTSPMRTQQDLEEAFKLLETDENAINLFSVSEPGRSPYFNMVEKKENGYYNLVKKTDSHVLTRQSAPQVYDMNASFYIYRRLFFELGCDDAITERSLIYLMPHACFDLDHPIDFEIMSFLVENKKLDFEL